MGRYKRRRKEEEEMTRIEELGISEYAKNCLLRHGIRYVEEIIERLEKDEYALLKLRKIGRHTEEEIKRALVEWKEKMGDRSKESYKEIVNSFRTVLARERMLKNELEEIRREKIKMCMLIAGVEDNELVRIMVENIAGCKLGEMIRYVGE